MTDWLSKPFHELFDYLTSPKDSASYQKDRDNTSGQKNAVSPEARFSQYHSEGAAAASDPLEEANPGFRELVQHFTHPSLASVRESYNKRRSFSRLSHHAAPPTTALKGDSPKEYLEDSECFRSQMHKPSLQSRFRPLDNLNGGAGYLSSRRFDQRRQRGTTHQNNLRVSSRAGENVISRSGSLAWVDDAERAPKRRKTSRSEDADMLLDEVGDIEESRNMNEIQRVAQKRPVSIQRESSSESRTSLPMRAMPAKDFGSQHEYHSVNTRLNDFSRHKRSRSLVRVEIPQSPSKHRPTPSRSHQNQTSTQFHPKPIDLTEDDQSHQARAPAPIHQVKSLQPPGGLANIRQRRDSSTMVQTTRRQSQDSDDIVAVDTMASRRPDAVATPRLPPAVGNTRNVFKRDTGESSDVDELQDTTTMTQRREAPAQRENRIARPQQPPSPQNASQSFSSVDGADIAPTQWRRGSSHQDRFSVARSRISKWKISYFWTSTLGHLKLDKLELVYDVNTNNFNGLAGGVLLKHDGIPLPLIRHSKVNKILHAGEGGLISIVGPRDRNTDYLVDIQVADHFDDFLMVLKASTRGTAILYERRSESLMNIFVTHKESNRGETANANRTSQETQQQSKVESSSEEAPKNIPVKESRLDEQKKEEIQYEPSEPLSKNKRVDPSERRRSSRLSMPGKYTNVAGVGNDSPEPEKYTEKHGLGPEWDQPVVYPTTGAKRVTVDFRDLPRLDEGEFLNDNLIAFYLRFCEEVWEERAQAKDSKVYFFSTYFYTALMSTESGKAGFNYKAVQRWTSKVDLFDYDYIIVPINQDLHWYVAIICNLPNLPKKLASEGDIFQGLERSLDDAESARKGAQAPKSVQSLERNTEGLTISGQDREEARRSAVTDEEAAARQLLEESKDILIGERSTANLGDGVLSSPPEKEPEGKLEGGSSPASGRKAKGRTAPVRRFKTEEPAIIVLDSLGLSRSHTTRSLKQYIIEEARSRRSMDVETKDIQGVNATNIPMQDNYCDCGIYSLAYIAKFLDDPRNFVRKIMHREPVEFPGLDASQLRSSIRDLLQDIHEKQAADRETEKAERAARRAKKKKDIVARKRSAEHQKEANLREASKAKTTDKAAQKTIRCSVGGEGAGDASRLREHTATHRSPPPRMTRQEKPLEPTRQPAQQRVDAAPSLEDSVVFLSEQPVIKSATALPVTAQSHHDARAEDIVDPEAKALTPPKEFQEKERTHVATRDGEETTQEEDLGGRLMVPESPISY